MLLLANVVKLVAEIALMAMLGQWVLGLLAGSRKERNIFYQVLQIVSRPFVALARVVSPSFVLDRHVPLIAFLMLVFLWLGATVYRIKTCVEIGVEYCK